MGNAEHVRSNVMETASPAIVRIVEPGGCEFGLGKNLANSELSA
jgi:hypothetical protein